VTAAKNNPLVVMLIMLGMLYYLVRSIRQLAGLQLTEALKQS
jgi:hypothetical protein